MNHLKTQKALLNQIETALENGQYANASASLDEVVESLKEFSRPLKSMVKKQAEFLDKLNGIEPKKEEESEG